MSELITFYSELFASSARLQRADEIIANEMLRNVPPPHAARIPRKVRRHFCADERRRDFPEVHRHHFEEPGEEPLGPARRGGQRHQKRRLGLTRNCGCCCSMA